MPTKPIDFRLARNRALRVAVFGRDAYTCQRCRWRPLDAQVPGDYDGRYAIGAWPYIAERTLEMDHIIPRVAGGLSILANLMTLCGSCNQIKGARV